MVSIGQHLTVDMYGCKFDKLNDLEFIKDVMLAAIREANMNLINMTHHALETEGITALALLAESHMSIHTHPRLGYVAIDIFTLNKNYRLDRAILTFKRLLKPDKTKTISLMRGDFGSQKDMKPRVRVSIAPIRRVKNTGAKVLRFLARKS